MAFSVSFAVDVSGLVKIIDNLETVPEVLETYAGLMAEKAAGDAPVDTGALRDSITYEMIDDETARIHDGPARDGKLYGIFLELGTSKMAAQPFFIPAIMSYINPFIAAIKGLFK
jgi:HK97 gp10 family phage protein